MILRWFEDMKRGIRSLARHAGRYSPTVTCKLSHNTSTTLRKFQMDARLPCLDGGHADKRQEARRRLSLRLPYLWQTDRQTCVLWFSCPSSLWPWPSSHRNAVSCSVLITHCSLRWLLLVLMRLACVSTPTGFLLWLNFFKLKISQIHALVVVVILFFKVKTWGFHKVKFSVCFFLSQLDHRLSLADSAG